MTATTSNRATVPSNKRLAELARLRDLTRPIVTEGDIQREKIRKSNEG